MSQRAAAAQRRRSSGWSDPIFGEVAAVAELVAGLTFTATRQPSAETGMRRAMSGLKLRTPADLLAGVAVPGETRDALLAELTIGETYFFRDAPPLDLRLQELIAARNASDDRSALRIWSAGCASGEEPYSIAMRLEEFGWTGGARILGTDIAKPRLDAARRGRYTRWALRGVDDERVARWFARRGTHFILDPRVRAAADFAVMNLVSGDYPNSSTSTDAQDLVVCRNVLIYFELDTVAQIATRLLSALKPDGWLLLGASDPPLAGLVPCTVVLTAQGIAYRRSDSPHTVQRQSPAVAPIEQLAHPFMTAFVEHPERAAPRGVDAQGVAPQPDFSRLSAGLTRPPATPTKASASEPVAGDTESWAARIRTLADAGDLAGAGTLTAQALEGDPLNPELHYLHALLLQQAGRTSEAVTGVRRALYLDRTFVMAYLMLGDLLLQNGDREEGRRAFENARRLLQNAPPDSHVVSADAVSPVRLRQIAEQRLQLLNAGAP